MNREAYREIVKKALKKDLSRPKFQKLKREIGSKYGLKKIPKNSEILKSAKGDEKEKLKPLLLKKPTRSISGVSVVAVMTPPADCPHGKCLYCPQGPEAPQSYTGEEPAALRGRRNEFSGYSQVRNRLEQLKAVGHPTDKIELIIMGGTFPARPFEEQKEFLKNCFEGLADKKFKSFEDAKKEVQKIEARPIGITFETRPDYAKEKEINNMLELGGTRVELGVQNPDDEIYEKVERGHSVSDIVESTQLLKDSGFKINYHLMPGLPGSSKEDDLKMFKNIFENSNFKPDMIKIYPTLVMEGTKLYNSWKKGEYEPLTSEKATDLVAEMKEIVPRWVRIMRVQRDIPANLISAGVKKSNLRQLAKKVMKRKGIECSCIRCREVGHKIRKEGEEPEEIEIRNEKYEASGGTEFFISAEDFEKDILIGYIRLRIPSGKYFRPEINENTALIRELHVYGSEVLIGNEAENLEYQHLGYGEKLLKKAEKTALENGKTEILILSGLGVREYYEKFGYRKKGPYMHKKLEGSKT
ncbi:MAG: tRNA uridine(34) 5-carboxymethylaminomethyl modification radical SAM/GNAT enzyme Elp3 [Candidatus Undinarchaeales archaeon]